MTRSWRGRSRRSKGSIVTRSVSIACRRPEPSVIGPRRAMRVSKAVGQSSSVPRRRPIRWVVSGMRSFRSAEAGQMVRDLGAPRRPVVRHIVAPEVELVADVLVAQALGEAQRALERSGRVLPAALPAHEQETDARAQPVEVLAREVRDGVDRAVEVRLVAPLAPCVAPARRVVVPGQADGEWEQVGALEREVRGVVAAEAAAGGEDLGETAAIAVDPRDDLAE